MNYQEIIIATVEYICPTGSKRRQVVNIFGKPLAKLAGIPIKGEEEARKEGYWQFMSTAEKTDQETNNGYFNSIRNFLNIKKELFLIDPLSEIVFTKYEQPKVSILLVTYNKAEYTYQCLETIKAYSDVPYEVIIVDNASSDSTLDLLDRLKNVTVLKNDQNIGFLKACNQGLQFSKSKYVLYLNNDTQVTPCWLSKLISVAENEPNCGAVGAKLIFPNGKLQEAGSIIWRDGTALGYGRDSHPFAPEYSYLKEVDFCSGACLLVRKDLLDRLGGFDERYVPAYYEEADLCFALKDLGYKVMFQPDVCIVHYEFGSGSFKDASDLALANRQKFKEKWQKLLEKQLPCTEKNVLYARDKRVCKKILVIDDRVPAPYLGSGYPRTYELLQQLVDLQYVVTYFPLQVPEPIEPYTKFLQQKGIEVFCSNCKMNFIEFLEKRRDYYDVIIVSRPHNATEVLGPIRKISPNSALIYDAEALFALREILYQSLSGNVLSDEKKKELIENEIGLVRLADSVITVSDYEKKTFAENGLGDVFVWGHPVALRPTISQFGEREGILFVGSFLSEHSPNEDAAIYFINEVFPKIKKVLNCQLWIVGTNNLDSIKKLQSESVIVTGRVEDLSAFYEKCRLFVVPHRFAAGIPLKLLEAMSHGLPSVVSPLIAKQLDLKDEQQVLVGNSSDDFAQDVVRLYNNEVLWTTLRKASLDLVRASCDPVVMKSELRNIIESTLISKTPNQ